MTESGGTPVIDHGMICGRRPADGTPLDPVPCTSLTELPTIVADARAASRMLAARNIAERVDMLHALAGAVIARGEAFARLLADECGKPEAEAWLHEILPTADLASYWTSEGPLLLKSREPTLDAFAYPGKRALVERLPRGVVALITPWNFPLAIPLRTIFPAILCGNAIVLKPSEQAARCAALLGEAVAEACGENVVRVVQGGGDVAQALIGSGVDAAVFTGGPNAGRHVAHAAADALIPVSLELGGRDAAIVLEDADLDRTARGLLWAAMANAGQNCAAVERVYAVKPVARALADRIAALTRALEPGRDFGPMTTATQRSTVEKHVARSKEHGANVLVGGAALEREGFWFSPTVLSLSLEPGKTSDVSDLDEETFGPVLPIIEVADERSAIDAANASVYGLTASVWTKNLMRGERIARELRAGVAVVNNHAFTGAIPSLPWSGLGRSGYGITNAVESLSILTRPRAIVVDASKARELWWHPYTPALVSVAKSMAALRSSRSNLPAKVGALRSLVAAFLRRARETNS